MAEPAGNPTDFARALCEQGQSRYSQRLKG